EAAKKLLADAGFPNGEGFPDVEYLTTDQDSAKALAEALQAMWLEHLGVTVKIRQLEWTTYLDTMFKQEYDLAAGGWIGDYLDPLTFLDMWIKDGGNNRTGWSNEQFEVLLDEIQQTGDPATRYRMLKQAEELFLEERPVLPIYWYTRNYLISENLHGWNPLILDNHPYKFLKLKKAD
ncbi:MAG: ABC transporter substrate-binding protein, partial [Opitutales bacterium]